MMYQFCENCGEWSYVHGKVHKMGTFDYDLEPERDEDVWATCPNCNIEMTGDNHSWSMTRPS